MKYRRLYKFYNDKYGLLALEKRRLKIATLEDLNDPFEFSHTTSNDQKYRAAFHRALQGIFHQKGLISFSKNWRNPLLWSHYAGSHHGIAIGLDIADDLVFDVIYRKKREILPSWLELSQSKQVDLIERSTRTKFDHWSYEEEVRCFVTLEERDPENNLFFKDFDGMVIPREVVLGLKSGITSQTILDLDSSYRSLSIRTARLALNSFGLVEQRTKTLRR